MNIQYAGKKSLTVYLDDADIANLRLEGPDGISKERARDALRQILGSDYAGFLEGARVELYRGRGGLLLFAYPCRNKPHYFAFKDFEMVVEAASHCPKEVVSFLSYMDGEYILSILGADCEAPSSVLFEFGTYLDRPGLYSAFLEEHGKLIAGPDAVMQLKKYFLSA